MKRIALLFFIFFTFLSCKKENHHLTKITAKTIAIDSIFASDNEITKTIAPYKKKMIVKINTVLSYSPKNITRTDGELESSLGNLLGDLSFKRVQPIFYKKTGKNIHFALFNYGGIRACIAKGNVSNKNAFKLMPFENNYVVAELSGEKMVALINYLIKLWNYNHGLVLNKNFL